MKNIISFILKEIHIDVYSAFQKKAPILNATACTLLNLENDKLGFASFIASF